MSRAWGRLTLPGKVIFTLLPLLLVATVVGLVAIVLLGPLAIRFIVAATAVLLMSVPTAFIIIYMEMKVIALMNLRIGPDRVGPWGTLLSVVHGLKVLMKEDFTPTRADPVVFTWAPVVVFATMALSVLVIPFAPGLFAQDFNLAL